MVKLLSRTKYPPGSFQVLLPESGMKEPFQGGFEDCVGWLLAFVRKNPVLAQRLHLPTTRFDAEEYVDFYNARRCIAHGWLGFVDMDTPPSEVQVASQKKTALAAYAGSAGRKIKAAASAWAEMFGKVGPASKEVAEQRAAVCVGCPKNDMAHGLMDYLNEGAASKALAVLGALRDLDLVTSHNEKLGICRACGCPTKAKVFANIGTIVEKMPPETWPELSRDPTCWILTAANRQ
jgi:hypothetical protein